MAHTHAHEDGGSAEIALTLVTIFGLLAGLSAEYGGAPQAVWIGYGLAYLAGGLPAAREALHTLWHERVLDIDLLMVAAALAAASVGAPMEGAVLLALFSLSSTLESRAMGRARRAVEALMELRPDTALRRTATGSEEVPAAALAEGDVVILRPGARVPVDGVVAHGHGSLDESTITGESLPQPKAPGAPLYEATVNLDGVLDMRVTRPLADSTVARMIRLVTEAQAARAPSERFSDWFGQRYTVAVLLGAIAAYLVMRLAGLDHGDALYRAATLLVAASPCAVVISVPAAILSALSAAARGGVLFKGGAALETLAAVRAFAFDKTGTLTTGRAELVALAAPGMAEEDFLARLLALEAQSEHPVAGALRRAGEARGVTAAERAGARSLPSEGIVAGEGAAAVWAGNPRMVARMGARIEHPQIAALAGEAATTIYYGEGDRLLGAVAVADGLRPTSAAGLAALRASGVTGLAMMTGDRRAVAERIGAALGLRADEIHADLLPGDKVALVAGLARHGKVAFVGDGVNDAAALARADVGIAMGAAGSEVALQAADVALLSENMQQLAAAHRLARRAARIIRQNLIFALGMMALLVAGALWGQLPLPLAVLGHEGGTVLVVLNGLRLLADPIRQGAGKGAGRAAA